MRRDWKLGSSTREGAQQDEEDQKQPLGRGSKGLRLLFDFFVFLLLVQSFAAHLIRASIADGFDGRLAANQAYLLFGLAHSSSFLPALPF
jgi:hypothetical protein